MDTLERQLVWLAGIIDGEGNIHVGSKVSQINGKRYLDMKVRISNTDLRMLEEISRIYTDLDLRFHYATVNWNKKGWKRALSINTTSQGSNKKLLEAVYPYLISKKRLAKIALNILDLVVRFPRGGNTSSYNYWEIGEMKILQGQYGEEKAWYFDPSTTSRRANTVLVFDDKV